VSVIGIVGWIFREDHSLFQLVYPVTTILMTLIGFTGAFKRNRSMLILYGAMLIPGLLFFAIFFLLYSLISGVAITVAKPATDAELQGSLVSYDVKNNETNILDKLQAEKKCCGTNGYASWSANVEMYKTKSVPDSCCQVVSVSCGTGKNTPEGSQSLNSKGCVVGVTVGELVLLILGFVMFFISLILQVFIVVVIFMYAARLRSEQYVKM